ncbi:unnamed protein product, partial [Chrysoparadoxa australica]
IQLAAYVRDCKTKQLGVNPIYQGKLRAVASRLTEPQLKQLAFLLHHTGAEDPSMRGGSHRVVVTFFKLLHGVLGDAEQANKRAELTRQLLGFCVGDDYTRHRDCATVLKLAFHCYSKWKGVAGTWNPVWQLEAGSAAVVSRAARGAIDAARACMNAGHDAFVARQQADGAAIVPAVWRASTHARNAGVLGSNATIYAGNAATALEFGASAASHASAVTASGAIDADAVDAANAATIAANMVAGAASQAAAAGLESATAACGAARCSGAELGDIAGGVDVSVAYSCAAAALAVGAAACACTAATYAAVQSAVADRGQADHGDADVEAIRTAAGHATAKAQAIINAALPTAVADAVASAYSACARGHPLVAPGRKAKSVAATAIVGSDANPEDITAQADAAAAGPMVVVDPSSVPDSVGCAVANAASASAMAATVAKDGAAACNVVGEAGESARAAARYAVAASVHAGDAAAAAGDDYAHT